MNQSAITGPLGAVLAAFERIAAEQRTIQGNLNEFASGIRATTTATNRLADAWRSVATAARAAAAAGAGGSGGPGGGRGAGAPLYTAPVPPAMSPEPRLAIPFVPPLLLSGPGSIGPSGPAAIPPRYRRRLCC